MLLGRAFSKVCVVVGAGVFSPAVEGRIEFRCEAGNKLGFKGFNMFGADKRDRKPEEVVVFVDERVAREGVRAGLKGTAVLLVPVEPVSSTANVVMADKRGGQAVAD